MAELSTTVVFFTPEKWFSAETARGLAWRPVVHWLTAAQLEAADRVVPAGFDYYTDEDASAQVIRRLEELGLDWEFASSFAELAAGNVSLREFVSWNGRQPDVLVTAVGGAFLVLEWSGSTKSAQAELMPASDFPYRARPSNVDLVRVYHATAGHSYEEALTLARGLPDDFQALVVTTRT